MQLVATVSIPKKDTERQLILTPESLKKRRKQGLPIEWYVLDAIQMSYGHNNPSIVKEHFCEEWDISEDQFDAAIAKQQKKGNLHRPDTTVQLELFNSNQQD